MIWFFLFPAVFLLIGMGDLPIGYYTFLRIVVFIPSCITTYGFYYCKESINFGVMLFGVIALLFNPIFPIYLEDKELWANIDFFAAVAFVGTGIYLYDKMKKDEEEKRKHADY